MVTLTQIHYLCVVVFKIPQQGSISRKTLCNIRLIVALTRYHSRMVLAMDFVSYDGLSIVSQDTINRSAS
jgi:hypothetical protein